MTSQNDPYDGFTNSPVGHWVECRWNFEYGQGEPHPDDVSTISHLFPYAISAECIGVEKDFFILKREENVIRVKPFSIRIRPCFPKYPPGTLVRTVISDTVKTLVTAPVSGTAWHVKDEEWTYTLKMSGKGGKRIYREADLEHAS